MTTLYRVRDKDWKALHGENLTFKEATELKERVVALLKISTTARVEAMSVPPPDWWVQQHGGAAEIPDDLSIDGTEATPSSLRPSLTEVALKAMASLRGRDYSAMPTIAIEDLELHIAPCAGVIRSVPRGCGLRVNEVAHSIPVMVEAGNRVQAYLVDPQVIAARAAAAAAVTDVMRKAQKPRIVPKDVTIKQPAPRTKPAPPDRTASQQPPVVRLGTVTSEAKPLPSPLKVATLQDGDVMPEGTIGEDDIQDLAVDLGGGPSDADLEHAKREAEKG